MFKYGERLSLPWWRRKNNSFRFRQDPVPYISHGWSGICRWYQSPSMRKRERSLYFENKDYIRKKRSPANLPDPWDDNQRSDVRTCRSWKNKKIRKQWMKH